MLVLFEEFYKPQYYKIYSYLRINFPFLIAASQLKVNEKF